VIWIRKHLKDPRIYRSSCPSAHVGQGREQEEVSIPSSILLNYRESPPSSLGFLWEEGDERKEKAKLGKKRREREK